MTCCGRLHRRRVAVRVTVLRERPASDPTAPVLTVQARLDVGGTPVAWCEETIFEAVFAQDRGRPAVVRWGRGVMAALVLIGVAVTFAAGCSRVCPAMTAPVRPAERSLSSLLLVFCSVMTVLVRLGRQDRDQAGVTASASATASSAATSSTR